MVVNLLFLAQLSQEERIEIHKVSYGPTQGLVKPPGEISPTGP